jgi:hypothetical protein
MSKRTLGRTRGDRSTGRAKSYKIVELGESNIVIDEASGVSKTFFEMTINRRHIALTDNASHRWDSVRLPSRRSDSLGPVDERAYGSMVPLNLRSSGNYEE